MPTALEELRDTWPSIDETEARILLRTIRSHRGRAVRPALFEFLAADPDCVLPASQFGPISIAPPIHGTGIPASDLVIRDRR